MIAVQEEFDCVAWEDRISGYLLTQCCEPLEVRAQGEEFVSNPIVLFLQRQSRYFWDSLSDLERDGLSFDPVDAEAQVSQ